MEDKKINLTQTCCEWIALLKMAEMLVKCPKEMIAFFMSSSEAVVFGTAIGRIDAALMAGSATWPGSLAVLLEETEHDLLVRLADWFEELLIEHSDYLTQKDLDTFKKHWGQIATIKRNFHYAKHQHTEQKNDVGE